MSWLRWPAGVKPVTDEPWARDLSRFENPYDRITSGFDQHSEEEAIKQMKDLHTHGALQDFQSKVLNDTIEYHDFIKEQRFRRQIRGSSYDEYFKPDPGWFHV